MINARFFNRSELIGFISLALLLFIILPLTLDVFVVALDNVTVGHAML